MIRSVQYVALAVTLGLAVPAHGAAWVFKTNLTGAAERPAAIDTPGSGTATVTVDDAANTLRVQAKFAKLTAGVTSTHIHCCGNASATAGVATAVPSFPDFPSGVTEGSYDKTFNLLDAATYNPKFIDSNGGTPQGARDALIAGLKSGGAYFNVHTKTNAAGEIRGQLAAGK